MKGSYNGKLQIELFGSSHGEKIGARVFGLPMGMPIDAELIRERAERRRPGGPWVSSRREADQTVWTKGVENGVITGDCVEFEIANTDARPGDYIPEIFRPSHGDYTHFRKYGTLPTGGGDYSGRMTAPLVVIGALCETALRYRYGFEPTVGSLIRNIGPIPFADSGETPTAERLKRLRSELIPTENEEDRKRAEALLSSLCASLDSVGGSFTVWILAGEGKMLPVGLGEPFFDSFESRLSSLLFSIPGVKGVSFGDADSMITGFGSEMNDPFAISEGHVVTTSNHSGGLQGGLTNGMPVYFTVKCKPTPSIGIVQKSVNRNEEETELQLNGRHDPCFMLRAIPAAEAVTWITLYEFTEALND